MVASTALVEAASSAGVQAGASAKVFSEPLTVAMVADLRFGALASGDIPGTVTVPTQGTRFPGGGAILLGNANFGPAEFAVTGQPDATYTIMLPDSVTIQHDSGANPDLLADTLTSLSTTFGVQGTTGKVGLDGTDSVYVGATLQVPANASNGNYSGEITITVAYD